MKDKLVKAIATFFYVGYLPFMPGTWGSLAGVIIYFLVRRNICLFLSVFAVLFFLGLYAAGKAEDIFGKKDDKRIVIDEVSGILLVYLLIPPTKLSLIIGFLLFRLFDIFKPNPAKKLEKLSRGWAVMADDVLSALFTYIIVSIAMLTLPAFVNQK